MATTGATREGRAAKLAGHHEEGGSTAVRLGVLWGYPFSLVRRLSLAFLALLAVCVVGVYVLAQTEDPVSVLLHGVPIALAILISMYMAEVLGVTVRPQPKLKLETVFTAIATSCFIMGIGYLLLPTYAPSVTLVCSAPVLAGLAVFLQRKWAESRGESDAVPAALFATTRREAVAALATLTAVPRVHIRAVVLPGVVEDRAPITGLPVIAPADAFESLARQGIRYFLVSRPKPGELRQVLAACAGSGYLVETVSELVAKSEGRVDLQSENEVSLLSQITHQASPAFAQRCTDLLIAGPMFAASLVLWPLIALAIRLDSRGPILFRQSRVGLWGQTFNILKFRTMQEDAEDATGPVWARQGDPRVTRVGRILRATRLDELPQLWNVVRGDMSIVGPRPERPFFVKDLRARIPLYEARQSVRPGVTGWAQIRYPYGASEEDAREKLAYDLFYILHRSATFYFAVILETAKVLIFRRGSR